MRAIRWSLVVAALVGLASCGDDDTNGMLPPNMLPPSRQYVARCATPRSGADPATGQPYLDRQGTLEDEKTWVRSWIDEIYLWYREVPSLGAADYATPIDYFNVLKTAAITPSGKPKDQFHFTLATADWEARSLADVQLGYGVTWAILQKMPPRQVVAAYTDPGSPAANANVGRGAEVLTIDGVDVAGSSDVDTLNAGLFPTGANETHTFEILDLGAAAPRMVTMVSASIESPPVENVKTLPTANGTVGYMQFNDHTATAEAALIAAVNQLEAAGVGDLILDMRYNGGGYLAIASELAYMIAGPAATTGKTFEQFTFNDKFQNTDPITGQPNTPYPFLDQTIGLSAAAGQALPALGLARVFVITGPGTCSASESVINGLRGVDVEVIGIGSTTCGKPYGFEPQDNCGTTYFAIEFQGVNEKGFGEYADGFAPGGADAAGLPGCAVADDFTHPLGDPGEARLAVALGYRASQTCAAAATLPRRANRLSAIDGQVIKPPWLQNRILLR